MKLLQIEFIKLFRPSTYVWLLILLVYLVGGAVLTLQFSEGPDKLALITSHNDSPVKLLAIFFSVFMIMNIGQEFSENTLRRAIIEGETRTLFFLGKILLVLFVGVFLLALQKGIYLAAAAHVDVYSIAAEAITQKGLFANLFLILYYGVFGTFLIFLLRSIAISIVLCFIFPGAEFAAKVFLFFKYPDKDFGQYLPFTALDKIIDVNGVLAYKYILISLIYQLVMLAAAYLLLMKKDIK